MTNEVGRYTMRSQKYKSLKRKIAVAIFFSLGLSGFWLMANKLFQKTVAAQTALEEFRLNFASSARPEVQLRAAEPSGFVIYQSQGQAVCRTATTEEAQALARRDP